MKLSKSLTTVTRFSKIVAMGLFVSLPFIGFILGMRYQKSIVVTQECEQKLVK